MGIVVSALAAAGPAVLEDLETPYAVLQERKEQEKAREERRRETKAKANRVKKAIPARRRSPEPLVVRTYTAAVPPTPSHKAKRTLASPKRPPSRERENTPPPQRPSSVTRKTLQRQNSVHSLPSSSSPSKNSTERSRSRGSLQMTPASDVGLSSTPAKSPSREGQTSATPVKTPTKERSFVSSREVSPVSTTASPNQNNIPSSPQVLLVAPKTPSKKRLERGNHVDNPESDLEEPLEKTTNPGVAIAVEEAIKNMFNQVDETTADPYYYNQVIREEEEESWILADSTLPEPAATTYKVSPTKSSKLRKQSARRRIKTLDSLPLSRRDELQAYAGQYLPKSRRSSAKPKKVLHQSEWQP